MFSDEFFEVVQPSLPAREEVIAAVFQNVTSATPGLNEGDVVGIIDSVAESMGMVGLQPTRTAAGGAPVAVSSEDEAPCPLPAAAG